MMMYNKGDGNGFDVFVVSKFVLLSIDFFLLALFTLFCFSFVLVCLFPCARVHL